MKRWAGIIAVILAVTVTADLAFAQRGGRPGEGARPTEGGREGGRGGRPGESGRGGRSGFGSSFASPIQTALDADKDGVISAKEIENAVVALRSLDKNKDGKLDRDELRPPRPDFSGGRPGEGGRPGQGGRPTGAGSRGGSFAERLLAYDKNKDGKISKDESPEFLKQRFDQLDSNKDGSIDKKEIEALAARFSGGRSQRPGGGAGGRPQRPGGGEGGRPQRPGGAEGGRPQRPGGAEGGDRPRRPSGDDA